MTNKIWTFPVIITFCVLLAACSKEEGAEQYIVEAQDSLKAKQLSASIIALKNAIKIEPNNAKARFLLGTIYLEQGSALNAVKEFEKAKQFKYSKALLFPKLARAYFLAEDVDAIYELTDITGELTLEAQLPIFLYQIITHLKLEQIAQAKKLHVQAIQLAQESGYTLLSNAYIHFYEENLTDAKQTAEEALSKLPAHPEAIILLANLESIEGNYTKAAEYYEKYLKLQPLQRSTEIMLANMYLQAGKFDLAEKHVDNILSMMSEQPFANHIKAMVSIESKNYEAASKHAEKALANNFKQPTTRLIAGVSSFYLGNYEQANYHLKPLMQYLPADHFSRRMLVVSQLELGIIEDVTGTLGLLEQEKESNEFYTTLSYKLLQAGATNEAKKLLSSLKHAENETAENLLREGVLKALTNDQSALKSLEKALELDPKMLKAELLLAHMAIQSGDIAKAQRIAQKWQQQYPDKVDGYNLAVAIDIKRGNVGAAKKLLEKSLNIDGNNVYALAQLSQLASVQGHTEQAQSYIQKALTVAPNNINVLRQYYRLIPNESSLTLLKEKSEQHQDNISYRLLYAEALVSSQQVKKGLAILQSITPNHKTPKFYWVLKLAVHRHEKDISQLKSTAKQWQKIMPYQIEPTVLLAEIYRIERNYKQALVVVDAGLEKHAGNITLTLAKIEILFGLNRTDDAKKLYQSVSANIDNKYIQNGIEGKLALLDKNFVDAVQRLEPVYQAAPNAQNLMYLVSAYAGNKQQDKAINVLNLFLEEQEFNEHAAGVLANLYIESGNNNQALTIYKDIIKQKPNNIIALNNAAWLSMESGDLKEAIELAEHAIALVPEAATVLDTYSQVLFKAGNKRIALEQAKKAFELSEGKLPDISLNYIGILIDIGRKNEARKILKTVSPQNNSQTTKRDLLLSKIQ